MAERDSYFLHIQQSEEYQKLPEAKRKAFLQALQNVPDHELKYLGEQLTYLQQGPQQEGPRQYTPEELLKGTGVIPERSKNTSFGENIREQVPTAIDMAGQAGGAYLLGKVGMPTTGEALGGYLANQANKALGFRQGKPFSDFTTDDITAVGLPYGVRTVLGAAKRMTRPAQTAIKEAEATNLENQAKYAADVEKTNIGIQRKVGQLDEKAFETNEANRLQFQQQHQEWRTEGQKLRREYQKAMSDVENQAFETNQERSAEYRRLTQEYQARAREHNDAFVGLRRRANEAVPTGDYRATYRESGALQELADDVDVESFRDVARGLGVNLRQPAEGVQSKFRRITDALQEFGVTQADNAATSTAEAGPVPLQRVIATQKAIGKIVGDTVERGGDEHGAAKKLYAELADILDNVVADGGPGAEAVEMHRQASREFMRAETMRDIDDMWMRFSKETAEPGQTEMRIGPLRTAFRNFRANDRFANMALTPDEWRSIQDVVDQLPREQIGRRPPTPEVATPDYSKVIAKLPGPEPQPKPQVTPDYEGADFPSYPEPPQTVEPAMGGFPWGRTIMAKTVGAQVGGNMGGVTGDRFRDMTLMSMGAAALSAAPYFVSRGLMAHPTGRQIVENLMAAKKRIGPDELTILTQAARQLGISTNDGDYE